MVIWINVAWGCICCRRKMVRGIDWKVLEICCVFFIVLLSSRLCFLFSSFPFLFSWFCEQIFSDLDSRMSLSSWNVGKVEDLELLSAVPSWDYYDYVWSLSCCYHARRFTNMAMSDCSLSIFESQGRLRNPCIGLYVSRWRALSR